MRQSSQILRTSRWASDRFHRGGDQERLDAHVAQAGDGAGGVVGVQRAEHHVPGQGGLDGDLGGFQVADLADQDLVGVLPQDGPQGRGERHADFGVDRHLDEAVDVVLDRVLGGDDLLGDVVELVEARIQRRGLARAGRPGDQHDAVGLVDQLAERVEDVRLHADAVEVEADVALVEHAAARPPRRTWWAGC